MPGYCLYCCWLKINDRDFIEQHNQLANYGTHTKGTDDHGLLEMVIGVMWVICLCVCDGGRSDCGLSTRQGWWDARCWTAVTSTWLTIPHLTHDRTEQSRFFSFSFFRRSGAAIRFVKALNERLVTVDGNRRGARETNCWKNEEKTHKFIGKSQFNISVIISKCLFSLSSIGCLFAQIETLTQRNDRRKKNHRPATK